MLKSQKDFLECSTTFHFQLLKSDEFPTWMTSTGANDHRDHRSAPRGYTASRSALVLAEQLLEAGRGAWGRKGRKGRVRGATIFWHQKWAVSLYHVGKASSHQPAIWEWKKYHLFFFCGFHKWGVPLVIIHFRLRFFMK